MHVCAGSIIHNFSWKNMIGMHLERTLGCKYTKFGALNDATGSTMCSNCPANCTI